MQGLRGSLSRKVPELVRDDKAGAIRLHGKEHEGSDAEVYQCCRYAGESTYGLRRE